VLTRAELGPRLLSSGQPDASQMLNLRASVNTVAALSHIVREG